MRLCNHLPASILLAILLHCPLSGRDFNVLDYGAVSDGKTLNTTAIQNAIHATAEQGGRVVFPPGKYLCGSIRLKSGVTLHLEKGATLLGSTNPADYQRLNFLALVIADRVKDIGISGEGEIDGQGKILAKASIGPIKQGAFPDAGEAKRPVVLNFRNCSGVTVRNVTLRESACWMQLYRDCDRVLVENLTVRTMAAVTNDGLDLDGCSNVIVRGCDIDSEDDAICLKSSARACENVLIENCRIRSTCNALKFGTASFKGFKNVTARNLEIHDTYLSGIALEIVDGGAMENILISKVRMKTTNNPIFIRLGQRQADRPVGSIRNVTISDVTADIPNRRKSEMNKFPEGWRHLCTTLITGSITGLPGHPVTGVTLKNIAITYGGIGNEAKPGHLLLEHLDKVPECSDRYPESKMFGVLPAWGLYCRHVEGLNFENVQFKVTATDYRAAVILDDVRNLKMDRFQILSAGKEPPMILKDVIEAAIVNSRGPAEGSTWIAKKGNTRNVTIR
ncbi:MAG: glycoside hydrolase family 28 [Verrucomicrobiales bacterium VVV1]|nr:MAG: glycoside hydrolase family 28 [Verrucomicrobiales bacterium VVV1]